MVEFFNGHSEVRHKSYLKHEICNMDSNSDVDISDWMISFLDEQAADRSLGPVTCSRAREIPECGGRAVEASHPLYHVAFVNCCAFEMGCTRSKINLDICGKDEDEWMKKTMPLCSVVITRNPETQNNNIGLFSIDSTRNNMNSNMDKCECG